MRKIYQFSSKLRLLSPAFIGFALLLLSPLKSKGQVDSLKTETLDQVVVSATRTPKNVFDVGRNVSVIPKERIEKSIYSSVAELLSAEEGIFIVGTNQNPGTNQSLFLRGANSNHTNILIDGVHINDPSTPNSSLDLSELSLLNVERIEIVRGAHGTMYGSSSIGGVINIITKKQQKPGLNGFAEVQGGTFGKETFSLSEEVFLNYSSKGGFYTNLSFLNKKVQGLDASIDTVTAENVYKQEDKDGFDKLDAVAKLGFANEKLDVYASYKHIDQTSDIDDGAFNDDDNNKLNFERNLLNYGGHYQFSPSWRFQLNGGWSSLERQSTNDSSIVDFAGNYDHNYNNASYQGATLTNEGQLVFARDNLNLLIGAGHYHEKADFSTYAFSSGPFPFESAVNYDSIDLSTSTQYLFLQTGIGGGVLSEQLQGAHLVMGIRYSHHDQFGSNVNYEINPSYKFSEASMLYASYSTGFNAPSLVQFYDPTQDPASYTSRGNENLKPETSASFELGLKQKIGSKITLSIAYFNTKVENAIEYIYLWDKNTPLDALTFGDYLGDTYINIAKQKNNGIEFNITSDITENLSIRGGFSAVNGSFTYAPADINRAYTGGHHVQLFNNGAFLKEEVKQEGLVRRPVSTINLDVRYRPLPKLAISGNARFVSAREDSFYDPGLGPFGALNETPVDSYALLDMAAHYELNHHLLLAVKVENVLNQNYAEIKGFNTRGRGVYLKIRASL